MAVALAIAALLAVARRTAPTTPAIAAAADDTISSRDVAPGPVITTAVPAATAA